VGEREKRKRNKSPARWERERGGRFYQASLPSVTLWGPVGSERAGIVPLCFFLFFFLPCFIPLKQVGNNKTIKQMKTKKTKKNLFSPNFFSCGR
jgi:hypothetical protein